MADISKIKLPDNSVVNIKDARVTGVDSTPTSGSTNVVTSGGIHSAIQSAISSVYKYKGTKANYASLPSSGNVTGDVWNVEAAYGDYPAGTNWAWTGSSWDALGGEVDLSAYLTKTDASSTYATKTQLTDGSVTKLGTATVGGTAKPIYLNAGTPTALSATVGSNELPVYLNAGTLTRVANIHAQYLKGGLKTLGNTANFLGVDPAFNYNAYAVEQGATVQFYLDGVELVRTSDAYAKSLFNGLPSSGGQPFDMSNQSTYGDYSSSKSYVVGELCSYTPSGATKKMWYRNKLACSNIVPTNTTYWEDVSASGNYIGVDPSKFTSFKIVIKNLPFNISNENGLVLFWKTAGQRPNYVTVKKLDTNDNEYLVVENHALVGPSDPIYLGTGPNTGTQRGLILEFTGFTSTTYWNFVLTQIAFTGMGGSLSGAVLFRSGGTVFGTIAPYSNGLTSIGTSSNRWFRVYGVGGDFSGALSVKGGAAIKGTGNAVTNINGGAATVDYAHIFVTSNTNNTRPLVLQNGYGNVGIGVTTPTQKLEVDGNVKATSFIKSDGTASEFLKADGSTDDTDYVASNELLETAGEVIIGTQTAATGNWTGVSKLATASDMKSGYRFTYWLPYAGSGNATLTLTFQDGTTKAINCYWNGANRLTTHIGAGNKIDFLYLENASVAGTNYTGAWIDKGYQDGNNYDRIYSNFERRYIYSTATPLYRYKLCGFNSGKIVPLTITDQTTTTIVDKTPVSVGLDPLMGIAYYSLSSPDVTSTTTAVSSLYKETPLQNTVFTFNNNVPGNKDVYLKGQIGEDGLFYLDITTNKSWYVFASNKASDGDYKSVFVSGSYYMYVGPTSISQNYLQLKYSNPVFFYDGEKLIPFEEAKLDHFEERSEFTLRKSPAVYKTNVLAKAVNGNTIVWNQRLAGFRSNKASVTGTIDSLTFTANSQYAYIYYFEKSSKILEPQFYIDGHKYIASIKVKATSDQIVVGRINSSASSHISKRHSGSGDWEKFSFYFTQNASISYLIFAVNDTRTSGWDEVAIKDPVIFDLTQMFGAGNEPTTVEEFESLFPLPYYEYNPGELISFNATGIETTGFNQWDEEFEDGNFNTTTGENAVNTNTMRSKNYIPVIPGSNYYLHYGLPTGDACWMMFFDQNKNVISGLTIGISQSANVCNVKNYGFQAPANCFYVRFYFKKQDYTGICLNISNPSKNGTYEPYKKSTLTLDVHSMTSNNVLIFPDGMRSAGSVCDSAVVDSDGYIRKVTKRIEDVDLGTLEYQMISVTEGTMFRNTLSSRMSGALFVDVGAVCSEYLVVSHIVRKDKTISGTANYVDVIDNSYSDVTTFKSAVSGVYLYYELATPVEYTLDEPIFVGTEYYTGGVQRVIPENTSEPTTAPFSGKFIYSDTSFVEKQDKLTFDTTPTANSANPVTSGGIYAELADVVRQEDLERLTTAEITNLLDL